MAATTVTAGDSSKARNGGGINLALKAKYAFYSTLVFFLIANPETFKMTQSLLGWLITIADRAGCPTAIGFFIHSAFFFLVLWATMLFPKDPA
jgi:hypothetical protein